MFFEENGMRFRCIMFSFLVVADHPPFAIAMPRFQDRLPIPANGKNPSVQVTKVQFETEPGGLSNLLPFEGNYPVP